MMDSQTKTRITKILENFRKAKNKRQSKDMIWTELDAFDRNQQWDLNNAPAWLPKPVTNYIHLVKYTKRASFAVENPVAKLRPVSPKGVDLVKKLNKAYEDTFHRIKARKVIRENIETAKLLGTAIAHVYWNDMEEGRMGTTILGDEGFLYKGEIGIKEIEPSTFYPDPNAFSIDDCEFIIVRERKAWSWIEANPKFNKKLNEEGDKESTSNADERGEIYLRDYDNNTDRERLVDFISYYEREANEEGGFSYYVTYIANNRILLDREPLKPNRYPFAILYDFRQRQDFWGMSTCEFILDNQKIINKLESIITMIGILYQNPQKIVASNSGINPREVAKYGNAPNQVWVTNTDPRNSMHYLEPPNIPPVLLNLLEQAKANIREITGLTESYMGQNVGSLQTSSGVQALIDRATMRDRDQMYDIELYIEDLTNLIIDFMTTYYEEERLIRIFDETSGDVVAFETFVGTEFKDLAYDVAVDVSSKAPVTRMREVQEAKELLNLQGQYGQNYPVQIIKPQEAIEMMNLVHGNRIVERMNMEELKNKTDEALQVAQMMSEAMTNGVPPEEVYQMGIAMFEQMQNPNSAGQVGELSTMNPTNIPQNA